MLQYMSTVEMQVNASVILTLLKMLIHHKENRNATLNSRKYIKYLFNISKRKKWLPLIPWVIKQTLPSITPQYYQTLNFNTWKASDYDNTST